MDTCKKSETIDTQTLCGDGQSPACPHSLAGLGETGLPAQNFSADPPNLRQLDLDTLREFAVHPRHRHQIAEAQVRVYRLIDDMAEQLARTLAPYQIRKPLSSIDGMASKLAQFASHSKQNEQYAKARLDMARRLIIARIINDGNPDWNPADASTSWRAEDNPSTLLSLLMLGPVPMPDKESGPT